MASVGRGHGIGIQTTYAWRKRYGRMGSSEVAELKALQEENRRLKRLVANQAPDIEAHKELQRGKW